MILGLHLGPDCGWHYLHGEGVQRQKDGMDPAGQSASKIHVSTWIDHLQNKISWVKMGPEEQVEAISLKGPERAKDKVPESRTLLQVLKDKGRETLQITSLFRGLSLPQGTKRPAKS